VIQPPHENSACSTIEGNYSTSSNAAANQVGATQPRAATHDPSAPSTVPDWNLVQFNVGCARCGHDLRGLTEPVCPGCALTFDWSEAVPLEELTCTHCGYHLYGLSEKRCPECGETFTWDDVLTAYHRTRSPFFEYRYRARPVHSLLRAIADALRPRWLWSTMSLHDPPRVGALLILWLACAVLLVAIPVGLSAGFTELTVILWSRLYNNAVFFAPWRPKINQTDAAFAIFGLAIWVAVMFLTLASMHWSLKACRVRRAHVFRVCLYVIPPVLPLLLMLFVLMFVLDTLNIRNWITQRTAYFVVGASGLVGVAMFLTYAVMHVGYAYKRYIGMKHAWGVAIAANIAASVAALTVLSWRILVR